MTDVPFSAEPIVIVRLEQPRCALSFGVAPCPASGEPCFNTSGTCGALSSYTPGAPLYLYFGLPGAGAPSDDLYIFPYLADWPDTSPARVNVSGADRRANALGIRARASVTFRDAAHNDRLVDPYRAGRSYVAMDQGTFWSRWIERNKFGRVGMTFAIFEGFAGQALSEMTKRTFVADGVDFSGEELVKLDGTDPLSKAAEAQAPLPSPGYLAADISAAALSFKVAGAVEDDYPTEGTIRIGSEVMTYSARAVDANGLLDFTIDARGTDRTEADGHSADEQVQECLRLDDVAPDEALAMLYDDYTPVPSSYIPAAEWAAERETYLSAYRLDGLVSVPTDVSALVGEILEQVQALQWWDERAEKVKFLAVKPMVTRPPLLTEAEHIIAETFSIRDFPERRVSQVWVRFDQRDPTGSPTDKANYARVRGSAALKYEGEAFFGAAAIRDVFARFIKSDAVALETSSRIVGRYKEGVREVAFAVSDKDGGHNVGDVVRLRHRRVRDKFGAMQVREWIITSRDPRPSARRVYYTAEDATIAGQLVGVAANTVPDYIGDGSDPFGVAWISGDDGLLPNGDPGFFIQ